MTSEDEDELVAWVGWAWDRHARRWLKVCDSREYGNCWGQLTALVPDRHGGRLVARADQDPNNDECHRRGEGGR